MERVVTAIFEARENGAADGVPLPEGETLADCRIQRHTQAEIDAGAEPYVVHFVAAGREYFAPLPVFQARTRAAQSAEEAALAV